MKESNARFQYENKESNKKKQNKPIRPRFKIIITN